VQHAFPLPEAMVEAEFGQIWQQVEADIKGGNLADEDKNKSEDELRAEFRKIAERRVRLGLVLSEIGRINNIVVSQDEVNRALVAQARQYPGQEQRIVEFYQKNPDAVAQLRAPIFEDKVVDFLCTQIKIEDKTVTREELFKDPDDLAPTLAKA
jgi:trigger factor